MDELAPVTDLLAFQPMPKLAAALRERRDQVLDRWNRLVKALLPDADALTMGQVRNSIPRILDQMVKALESSDPRPTDELIATTRNHGAVRFHESYNVQEVIVEYRILRRILVEEMDRAYDGTVSTREWIALDMAVDIALQQAVLSFLEHQKLQLKAATEAEAKFLSFLAHDMRNGLNSILLTMQWVEQSLTSYPELQEELEGLQSARSAATSTIEGMERLLQAERLRKGVQAKREEVALGTLAQRVVADARHAVGSKALEVDSRVPADAKVISDEGLIGLVLQNLLGNAVKYSVKGRIAVEAQADNTEEVAGWRISVQDQGPGIAPDQVKHLFEAFTRGETHGQPGVGLGLFIASQAARFLGSRLEVASEVGVGTRFSFLVKNLPAMGAV